MAQSRRIVVTGGNRGIGFALCKQLVCDYEDTFVYLGSRSEELGREAVRSIVTTDASLSTRICCLVIDVRDDSSVATAAETVAQDGPLYAVVQNAGVAVGSAEEILGVNLWGPIRVDAHFLPLLGETEGRAVYVSSVAGPIFVSQCLEDTRRVFAPQDPLGADWAAVETLVNEYVAGDTGDDEDFLASAGFPARSDYYGLSKAALNAYAAAQSVAHPRLAINTCMPGFCETDMTRGMFRAKTVRFLPNFLVNHLLRKKGCTSPETGTASIRHLLFDNNITGNGRFYGSDAVRSPLDRYRGPGEPPHEGP